MSRTFVESMRRARPARVAASAALLALLAACGSSVRLDKPAPVEGAASVPSTGAATTAQSQVSTVDAGAARSTSAADAALAAAQAAGTVVYFDFDSYVVRADGRPVVEAWSRLVNADRARRIVVEGHTDERGGREYNLALGQKRAEAVVKAIALLGGTDAQMEAVSYGKERPVATGSDEASWAKNRRAELRERR